jgi:hypothetical protein
MIRLSLLQFRAQAAAAATALAVVAVTLAVSGPHLFGMYDTSGIATCQAHGDCVPLATSFVNKLAGFYAVFYFIGIGFLLVVPAIIGTFWGAPLITREFETGTFQLTWTPSPDAADYQSPGRHPAPRVSKRRAGLRTRVCRIRRSGRRTR